MKKMISWAKNKIDDWIGHFFVSPNILDLFGLNIYNSIRKCLVELCSNSYDADANVVKIYLPDQNKITSNSEIVVEDDGCGMTKDQFKNEYLYIARNRREGSGDTTASGRKVIGNKGIGKLAGFGIAETIKIETKSQGKVIVVNLKKSDFDTHKKIETSNLKH